MSYDVDKMYCGQIERGDVFLCQHNGQEKTIVVLQDSVLNGGLPTILGAVVDFDNITDGQVFANEVLIEEDFFECKKSGVCLLHKVVTVDRRTVWHKCGSVSIEKLHEIYAALDVNLGRFRDKQLS